MSPEESRPSRVRSGSVLGSAIVYEIWSTLILAVTFLPASGWLLNRLLARSGQYAVSDQDLVSFATSVPGAAFLLFGLGFTLLFWHAEQAGLLLIVVNARRGERARVSRVLWENLRHVPALLRLGLLQGAALLLAFLPVGLGLALTHRVLLSEFDFYYYYTMRPSAWWMAVAIGGALLAAYLLFAAWLYVRWIFAIPGIVFERLTPMGSVRASWERTRGRVRALGLPLAASWAVVLLLLWGSSRLILILAAHWLEGIETLGVLLPAVLATLGVLAAVELLIFILGKIQHEKLVAGAYLRDPATPPLVAEEGAAETPLPIAWIRAAWVAAGAVVVILAIGSAAPFVARLGRERSIEVTGHRGNKNRTPENTMVALQLAIEEGADFAEIDVQTTADGVVVLLHDDDLMRVAADPRRLRDVTYRELKDIDVGSWFDPAFHAERIPTLQEVIDAARDRIKLNIELKYTWDDPQLAEEVVRIIRKNDFDARCVVSSLRLGALAEVEASAPELTTGFIVFAALGDLSRMDADFLSISASSATPGLVRAVHRQGRAVHVWTVNDLANALSTIEVGVDNIITDEPRLIRDTIHEWNSLTRTERLVLSLRRRILDLEPPAPGDL